MEDLIENQCAARLKLEATLLEREAAIDKALAAIKEAIQHMEKNDA